MSHQQRLFGESQPETQQPEKPKIASKLRVFIVLLVLQIILLLVWGAFFFALGYMFGGG